MDRKMKICFIAGARPNFMKVAALVEACKKYPEINYTLIHTGQHYDTEMSKVFFDELGLPKPSVNLGVGSGEPLLQREEITQKLIDLFAKDRPDLVVVVGDVTSTLAGARAADRLGIPVAHVEAGLRSGNAEMFEEFNRIQTDHIAKFLFVTEPAALKNLAREQVLGKVVPAGNVMIDTLKRFLPFSEKSDVLNRLNLASGNFVLITLHRAENVDQRLGTALKAIYSATKGLPVVFPVHPRTKAAIMREWGEKDLESWGQRLNFVDPLGYIDFLALMKNAKVVLTDSGGIQEETTVLGVPCLTLRNETERPITVKEGTNEIVGLDAKKIASCMKKIVDGKWKKGKVPVGWDGRAAERIINFLHNDFLQKQTLLTTHAQTFIHHSKN